MSTQLNFNNKELKIININLSKQTEHCKNQLANFFLRYINQAYKPLVEMNQEELSDYSSYLKKAANAVFYKNEEFIPL